MEQSRRNYSLEAVKVKKKMTKAQVQLAIIKKKQCDITALTIVEHLLEHNINGHWLIKNLKHINRSHMEDVIEERAIVKMCGYVLCDKPLIMVINQQYHISTKNNKVYDISKRKNFCSSCCYAASNYLLKQMLTSPLWLRDKEEIPQFQILPAEFEGRSVPGEEVFIGRMDFKLDKQNVNSNDNKEENEQKIQSLHYNINPFSISAAVENKEENSNSETTQYLKIKEQMLNETTNDKKADNIKNSNKNCKESERNKEDDLGVITTNTTNFKKEELSKPKKYIKIKDGKRMKKMNISIDIFTSLISRVERNFKEWITEDTVLILAGEEDMKQEILNDFANRERYTALYEKLNRLEIQNKREDCTNLKKEKLNSLPHFSMLKEEGKKLEVKVRAFYQGSLIIDKPEAKTFEEDSDLSTVIPLTEGHAPRAMRRRIFLDKLNKILPDLLRALAGSGQVLSEVYFVYDSDKIATLKALISTFALSAENIVFRITEWTLVGLIIIKMLSLIHPHLKALLTTKQASMYISMILMSYKLDQYYLDRLVATLVDKK